MSKAREFIDFWIQNSVHAAEKFRTRGASQDVAELADRCVEAAKDQGLSEADLQAEIGDINAYIGDRLKSANETERDRQNPS